VSADNATITRVLSEFADALVTVIGAPA
jgi:hypothetical protein